MSEGAKRIAERIRAALRGRSDVIVALVFGSISRGVDRADSDVDVAVVGPGVDLLALRAELSNQLGREVDIVHLDDDVRIPLLEEILRDGVVAYERQAGDAALFRSRALATLETDRPWFARMRDGLLRRVAEKGI